MNRLVFILINLSVILILPVLALAETGSPLAEALAGLMQGIVFPVVSFFLAGLLGIVLQRLAAKYKLDIIEKNRDTIERAAYSAIAYVEEFAANKLKRSKVNLGSSEKLNLAVAKILESVPSLTEDQARIVAESMLARVKGAGATGETALQ